MVWVLIVLAIYLALLLGLAWFSVHPYRIPQYISPGVLGASQEDVEMATEDGILLRGWWSEGERKDRVAIFVHGYMMNRCELTPEAFLLWKRGVSCLLIDMRCHGKSQGKVCTLGHKERLDVRAAVQFARARHPGAQICLMGSSMGAAACALALADDQSLADAVILDSVYGRLSSAILGWWRFVGGTWLSWLLAPMPLVAWPLVGLNPFAVDITQAVAKLDKIPVLYFHGKTDRLALPAEAHRNFEETPDPKEIVWFDDCGHSEGRWEQPERHHAALIAFLERHGFLTE